MRQILTVFSFTFRENIKKKAFIISTVVILLLIVGMACIPRVIDSFSTDSGSGDKGNIEYTCFYIDEENAIPGGAEALKTAYPNTAVKEGKASELEKYKSNIKTDDSKFVIEVTKTKAVPKINILAQDFMTDVDAEGTVGALSKAYSADLLKAKGYSAADIKIAQSELDYSTESVKKIDISSYAAAIAITFIMFFAVYYYGYGVAMSIATEKTSRVMETLVVSAKPSRILIGKCLAMGVLGLLQFAVILAVGGISFSLIVPKDFTLGGMSINLDAFSGSSVAWLLLFFVLGYALYAVMNSVCGALVSKIEDLNSAMMPVMMIALVSFYLSYIAITVADGGVMDKAVEFIPFTAPFVMPFKLLNSDISTWSLVISALILAVSVVLVALISIRKYSASVLRYGKRQKLWGRFKQKERLGNKL